MLVLVTSSSKDAGVQVLPLLPVVAVDFAPRQPRGSRGPPTDVLPVSKFFLLEQNEACCVPGRTASIEQPLLQKLRAMG